MRTPVVAIWNELTPYRLHVMRRVERELPNVRVTNVFTHAVSGGSMPWRMSVDEDLDVRFDPRLRIPSTNQYFHGKTLALVQWILRVIAEVHPVVVMMHGHGDLTRLMLIMRLSRHGVPLAHLSDANMLDERHSLRPRKMLRQVYLRWLLSRMDAYLPMGTGGRAFYRHFGSDGRPMFPFPYEPDYSAIQEGRAADADRFRTTHGLHQGRRNFLYSGRLVPEKRVDLLLSCFLALREELHEWDLVVAGSGPEGKRLMAMVPKDARHRVRFLGFLQMDELRHAYRTCDVLVHPSAREPWALVINEAVASGLAVISTNITGAALDLVRHRVNGMLVAPGSFGDLVSAMRHVAIPANLAAMRSRSKSVLCDWIASADPVRGFAEAVEHFAARERRQT